jgi:SAM-dependent methyltransferase
MKTEVWRDRLEAFFELRARSISDKPTLEDLCYIAGRNPRLWTDERLMDDLSVNLLDLMRVNQSSVVLEVGCAAGFIASLVAPNVGKYIGVDLAEAPLTVARRLGLSNADFYKAYGENLKFSNEEFDSAFCYDVFSNFPNFADGERIIQEMLRVVRPGGRVLVGSIPDREKTEESQEIAKRLASGFGQQIDRAPLGSFVKNNMESGRLDKIANYLGIGGNGKVTSAEIRPEIVSYYFDKEDFLALGQRLRVETQIVDIHSLNPYVGTRFNAVFMAR